MKIKHGFISNSSSSSFVCDTEMGTKDVQQWLKQLLEAYNCLMGKELKYENVFGDVIHTSETEPITEMNWAEYHWYDKHDLAHKVIIRSANDNSIPYTLFELIEHKLSAFRIHRG